MRNFILILTAGLLASACSTTSTPMPSNTAVEDYILVAELKDAGRMRIRASDRWNAINERYVVYEARRAHFLIGFSRDCPALVDGIECRDLRGSIRGPGDLVGCMDVRRDANYLRSGFDTVRSCPITEIYPIDEVQAEELRNLGLAEEPGLPSR
ncbi:MAG: DUF6491 family protein [Pseudomonadota bacterium]